MKEMAKMGLVRKTIRVDDTLHLVLGIGEEEAQAAMQGIAKKALGKGQHVVWQDGSSQWISTETIVNTDAEGSGQYIWDKTGNRVKCRRFMCRKGSDGTFTKTPIGAVFRRFDDEDV